MAINVEGKKKQFYDLVQMDEFWWKYRFSPALPDVAEAVNTELEECQRQEDEIKSLQVSFLLISKFYFLLSSGYHIKYTFTDHLKPFKQLKGVLSCTCSFRTPCKLKTLTQVKTWFRVV